jgi:glycosyltransferase involved in cell wall biosynthesis
MILVFFCQSLDESDGISGSTTHWLKRLSQEYTRVYVFTLKNRTASHHNQNSRSVIVELNGSIFVKLRKLVYGLISILVQEKSDSIHFFQYQGGPYILICRLVFLFRDDCKFYQWKAHSEQDPTSLLQQLFINNLTFTSTPLTASSKFGGSRTRIVGQECDQTLFYIKNKPRSGIVVVGRINEIKNYRNIMNFFDQFIQRCTGDSSGLILSFYGKFESRKIEDDFHAHKYTLRNSSNIVYHGVASYSDLPEIYNASKLCLHDCPGALDRSIVESSFCGTPVISTNLNVLLCPNYAQRARTFYVSSLSVESCFQLTKHILYDRLSFLQPVKSLNPPLQLIIDMVATDNKL